MPAQKEASCGRGFVGVRTRTESSPQHWSKDFVEHLRTVHFTLAAVCVALILILARTNSPALQQIRQIVELKNEWPPVDLAFAQGLESEVRVDIPGYGYDPKLGAMVVQSTEWRQNKRFVVTFTPPGSKSSSSVHLNFVVPAWYPASASGKDLSEWNSLAQFPSTLVGFRSWWQLLMRQHGCYFSEAVYHEGTVFYGSARRPVPARLLEDFSVAQDNVSRANDGTIPLRFLRDETMDASAPFWLEAFDKDDWNGSAYVFPMALYWKGQLDQDAILNVVNARGWKWAKGTYKVSFSALAEETRELEPEDLEQIEKVLAERLANRSNEFEAFGMKFPITQVTIWGTVILLGVQLYFFLYLKQLSGKLRSDDPGWDVPWIAMNQSLLAQSILFFSVVVLPTCAASLVVFRSIHQVDVAGFALHSVARSIHLDTVVTISAVCVSFLLSIFSWKYRPRPIETATPPEVLEDQGSGI